MNFASRQNVHDIRDCYFYHSMDLPGLGIVNGDWDLIGDFDDYVGHVDLAGKRVLDVGTAGGFLSFEAEKRGAEVVSFDIQDGRQHQRLPFKDNLYMKDYEAWLRDRNGRIRLMKNSYWFAHRLLESKAQVVYGDVYSLPENLGTFDVVLVGQVLIHLSDGISALKAIAARCHDILVIVDTVLDENWPRAHLVGRYALPALDYAFWNYSIGFYREILAMLGFGITKTSQKLYRRNVKGLTPLSELTTLVARRHAPVEFAGTEDVVAGTYQKPMAGLTWLTSHNSSGFGNIEGPYPEFDMPKPVVWMTQARGCIAFSCSEAKVRSLHIRVLTLAAQQKVRILLNGRTVSEFALPETHKWRTYALKDLDLKAGDNKIEFLVSEHIKNPPDERELHLLFEDVGLEE